MLLEAELGGRLGLLCRRHAVAGQEPPLCYRILKGGIRV